MRRPIALLVAQAFLLLFTAVTVASLVGSIRFTAAYIQAGGDASPYTLPLARHYFYKVIVLVGLVTALAGNVRRRPWGRYALLAIIVFGVSRLAIELAVGFPDTPSLGPVPGNYYLRSQIPTEALGEKLMLSFLFVLFGYLGWRLATGGDIRDHFTQGHAGQQ